MAHRLDASPPRSRLIMETRYLTLLEPLAGERPCGSDLEYDPELIVLQTRAAPRDAPQYGRFVAPLEALNWGEIEARVIDLLKRGRDIRAFILLARCRIHLAGAEGLAQALALLAEALERFPDDIHPQRLVDGLDDPSVQANALSALIDDATFLAEVRDLAVDSGSVTRLLVRDVERALAIPRNPDAPEPESTRLQLNSLRERGVSALASLAAARSEALRIEAWARPRLSAECPDFAPILRLLAPFATEETLAVPSPKPIRSSAPASPVDNVGPIDTDHLPTETPPSSDVKSAPPSPESPAATETSCVDRAAAKRLIVEARGWFAVNEPSSPVIDLLRQAEYLIGRSYIDVVDAIPRDLLLRWREEQRS